MAHQASTEPARLVPQSYEAISSPNIPLPPEIEPNEADEESVASAHEQSLASRYLQGYTQAWSAGQVLLASIIPLVALIVWLVCAGANLRMFDTFAGEKIGGRFSQAQAKAIDVLTGALLAPLFMAALNHVWFDSARVSVVNEQQAQSIPLRTVAAASSTTAGNYDFLLLRDLLQGKTWRLFLFGLLTLLSAVSRTALSNIIAYEAYTERLLAKDTITLRLQRSHAIEQDIWPKLDTQLQLYDFTNMQNTEAARRVASLLTDLSLDDTVPRLTNKTYVGINATTRSLESLPTSVVELKDIPAFRISAVCRPDLPYSIDIRAWNV